jgi:hypothetical protein
MAGEAPFKGDEKRSAALGKLGNYRLVTRAAVGSTAPPDGLISELGAVFGAKHVLQHLNANDPRFPPDLLRGGEAENGSEVESPPSWNLLGIECGPDRDAHLVAVLFRNQEAIEEFVEQNPAAYQVITGCGPLTAAWLRVRGPVPRTSLPSVSGSRSY